MGTLFEDRDEYKSLKEIDEENALKKKLYNIEDDASDIDNIGNELLQKVQDKNIDKEVARVSEVDPFYSLKLDVYDFFRKTMNTISLKEDLLKKIDRKIDDYLDINELEFDQLMQLRRTYASDSQTSRDSILSLFKPVPGANSLLAENLSKKDDNDMDDFEKAYENMTGKDLEKLDKLLRVMKTLDSNEGEEK